MKTSVRVRWVVVLAAFALALMPRLRAEEPGTRPIQLASKLEAVIPAQIKSLLIENPTVRFWVTVNEEGKLVDHIALEATHHELLTRAEQTLQQAVFDPALDNGKAVQSSGEVTVYFFDPEQRGYQQGLVARPFGMTATDVASRRVYETSKARFAYRRAEPAELDRPVEVREAKVMVMTDAAGRPAAGECVVEYYIDTRGDVRAPRVVSSDNEAVALSALLTLQHTHYGPITRDGGVPAYVKVRQPMSFAPGTGTTTEK